MQVHFGADLLVPEWERSVVCIGTFDGVHLGHREVIRRALEAAQAEESPLALVTFDRHPAATLHPESRPPAISSLAGNLRIFESLGVALALILPFDRALSETSAEDFFRDVLFEKLRAASVVVGHDFAFGKDRVGTPGWLRQRVETTVVAPFEVDGQRVSSSAIRAAIGRGDFGVANRLLGRAWALVGLVVPGQKLGRTLGFPTLNLARSFEQAQPPDGIYAGRCETPFGDFAAAIAIGERPTVGGTHRTIEAYLLDYPGKSLYGAAVRLRFLERLREEIAFPSIKDLVAQMELDVEKTREIVKRHGQ